MLNPRQLPVDLDLYLRWKTAPEEEQWKWHWSTWDPIMEEIAGRAKDVGDLECPVCGEKALYVLHMAVNMRYLEKEHRRVYVAERWTGCHACQTQVHDRAEVPPWIKDEDIVWATEPLRQMAEKATVERRKDRGT